MNTSCSPRTALVVSLVTGLTLLSAPAFADSTSPGAQAVTAPTLMGSSIMLQPGENFPQGIARIEGYAGRLGAVRIFQTTPDPKIFTALAGRTGVVSFGLPPAQVLSGAYDAQFKAFFAAAPKVSTTWWSYFHEADVAYQKGELTDLQQFRDAYTHVSLLARAASNARLKNVAILVGYTANPKSDLKVSQFMPRSDLFDAVAFDNYNGYWTDQGVYGDPQNMVDMDKAAAASVGKPFAVAEYASSVMNADYVGRSNYLRAFGAAASRGGALFASYWNSNQYGKGAEYRLLDPAGQSALHDVVAGTPFRAPAAPVAVTVSAGAGSAAVGWQAPDNRGSALTGYTVTATDDATGAVSTVQASAGSTGTMVSPLTDGQSYTVRVTAANALGAGDTSAPESIVPGSEIGAPSAPVVTSVTAADSAATVRWDAPADNGGSSVTSYQVSAVNGSGAVVGTTTVRGDAGSATITGLDNGTMHTLQVVAINAAGLSPAASSDPVTPYTAPGAPSIGRAAPGNQSVTATWTPPADNGGAPVTSYTLNAVNPANGNTIASATVPGSATTGSVGGLINGRTYQVTVSADNGAAGPASGRSNVVQAATVPGAPVVSAGGGVKSDSVVSATAFWNMPSSNGNSPITGYLVTTYLYDGTTLVSTKVSAMQPAAARRLQVTGLQLRGTYRFSVNAVNSMGVGTSSVLTNLVGAY